MPIWAQEPTEAKAGTLGQQAAQAITIPRDANARRRLINGSNKCR